MKFKYVLYTYQLNISFDGIFDNPEKWSKFNKCEQQPQPTTIRSQPWDGMMPRGEKYLPESKEQLMIPPNWTQALPNDLIIQFGQIFS